MTAAPEQLSSDELADRLQRLSPGQRLALARLLAERSAGAEAITPIRPRPATAPLSFAQERVWFVDQLNEGRSQLAFGDAFRLRGALDRRALALALRQLGRRQEILRTVVSTVDGVPRQAVRPDFELCLRSADLSGEADPAEAARETARRAIDRPYDLGAEPPVRVWLLRLGRDDHVLVVSMHHIASDAWSWRIFLGELEELYVAARDGVAAGLRELPVQYADYAVWQRRRAETEESRHDLAYWRERLDGGPETIALPLDRPRGGERVGAFERIPLPARIGERLRSLARTNGTSPFVAALAAWAVLLSRYARQQDLVVGTPFAADRDRPEVADLIGIFVNMLPLRIGVDDRAAFTALLAHVGEVTLSGYDHGHVSFEQIVRAVQPPRRAATSPLFQVSFRLQEGSTAAGFADLAVERVWLFDPGGHFELTLALELADDAATAWAYDASLFERATILRLARQYEALLADVVERPETPVADLRLAEPPVRAPVPRRPPRSDCLHRLVEHRALIAPCAPAVADGDGVLTYAQLDRCADRLACRLYRRGVRREAIVGVCLPRSTQVAVAFLAALKAGAAYLPLDPAYPDERLRLMIEDAQPVVVLADRASAARLEGTSAPLLVYERRPDPPRDYLLRRAPVAVHPDDVAYVMYTSGSTGRPKGVCVTHRGVVGLVVDTNWTELGLGDRVAQLSNTSFDASTFELWGPLLNGATAVFLPDAALRDPAVLAREVAESATTVLRVPSALVGNGAHRAALAGSRVRHLHFGGDAVSGAAVGALRADGFRGRLTHGYGPTEATMLATVEEIGDREPRARVPIGRAISGSEVRLLDARLRPVAAGIPGELCIGGVRLARCYLGSPRLTAARFVPDPLAGVSGARMYRTGDLARELPDGRLEFLGRTDRQVKVRGFRVEPAEVEAALGALPGIDEAAVAVERDEDGEARLLAYAAGPNGSPTPAELRRRLAAALPSHLVPADVTMLDRLPRTANGKVDFAALPRPARAEPAGPPPSTATEKLVARVWLDLLGASAVGVDDDFFEVGGHSLAAVTLLARVEARTGVALTVEVLLDEPTVGGLAAAVDERRARLGPPRAPVERHVVRMRRGSRRADVVLAHPVGGSVLCYRALAEALDGAAGVVGLEGSAAPGETLAALASRYLDELQAEGIAPAAFGGWSSGGVLAQELARQHARREGSPVPVVLVDAWLPRAAAVDGSLAHPLESFAHDLFASAGERAPVLAPQLLESAAEDALAALLAECRTTARLRSTRLEELRDRYAAFSRNLAASRGHEPARHAGPIDFVRPGVSESAAAGWSELCTTLAVHELPGDHRSILRPPHVDALAALLAELLDR
jgi:amino acid adenylation domain-containing protein